MSKNLSHILSSFFYTHSTDKHPPMKPYGALHLELSFAVSSTRKLNICKNYGVGCRNVTHMCMKVGPFSKADLAMSNFVLVRVLIGYFLYASEP